MAIHTIKTKQLLRDTLIMRMRGTETESYKTTQNMKVYSKNGLGFIPRISYLLCM